jgi:hypothetical protein
MPGTSPGGRPAPTPTPVLTTSFCVINGAGWQNFALTSTDIPCGFTNLPSALAYYTSLTAPFDLFNLFAMPWVSRNDAILAFGLNPRYLNEWVLYCNVNSLKSAWMNFKSLGQSTTDVVPIIAANTCKANGLTYVAMAPFGLAYSRSSTKPVASNCLMAVGWANPPGGKLIPLNVRS